MKVRFRMVAIAVAIIGLGFGVAFGAGYEVGRGAPQVAPGGLTQQQLNSLLGINVAASAAGGQATTSGAGGGAAQRPGAAGGGQAGSQIAALAGAATGRVTEVTATSITIETRTGPQKINLAPATSFSKVAAGAAADINVGDTIVASGSRKDDGSYDATSVSQVPAALQSLLAPAATTATPTGR
jgi:hypothetical protein